MRIAEVYVSTQGEGPNVGERTCFVRFAGCNLRCPGWPCDTQFAIDPKKYRKFWKQVTPVELVQEIVEVVRADPYVNICFTGGEPMLQPEGELLELVIGLNTTLTPQKYEMFTNGTLEYPGWLIDHVALIMDWKLPGSGEDPYNQMRITNSKYLLAKDSVKFVCKNREDFEVAKNMYHLYLSKTRAQVYYGVVWNGPLQAKEIVEWVLEEGLPWKLNLQVHNMIWPAHERMR